MYIQRDIGVTCVINIQSKTTTKNEEERLEIQVLEREDKKRIASLIIHFPVALAILCRLSRINVYAPYLRVRIICFNEELQHTPKPNY